MQFDDYLSWYYGYIPSDVYSFWLYSRWRQFHDPNDSWGMAGISFKESFEQIQSIWKQGPARQSRESKLIDNFFSIMEQLRDNPAANIRQLIEESSPTTWHRTRRWLFGAR